MSMKFYFILGLVLLLICLVACSSNEKVYIFPDTENVAMNDLKCYELCVGREGLEENYSCSMSLPDCVNRNCTCITR